MLRGILAFVSLHLNFLFAEFCVSEVEGRIELRMNDPQITKHIADLNNPRARVRHEAIEALAGRRAVVAVPALVKALKASHKFSEFADREGPVHIVKALGEIGHPAAVPCLIEMLTDRRDEMRLHAAQALGEIGDPYAVPCLIEALTDRCEEIRLHAVQALGQIGDVAAVPALIEALRRPGINQAYILRLVEALHRIDSSAAVAVLVQSDRTLASYLLGTLHSLGAPVLSDLLRALTAESPEVRRRAAAMLGKIGDREACPVLIAALQDESAPVRLEVAYALECLGDPAGVPALIALFEDKHVRAEVFQMPRDTTVEERNLRITRLGSIAEAGVRIVPTLLDALNDAESIVRCVAAEGLRRLGNSETLPRKILAAEQFPVPERIALLAKLREVRRIDVSYQFPETLTLCREVLQEEDQEAREGAAAVVGWLTLLRGASGERTNQSIELLHPTALDASEVSPSEMLRATDPARSETASPPRKARWQKWRRS